MTIDNFLYNLFILLLPGSVSYCIFNKTAIRRRENKNLLSFKEICFIFIASFISSSIYDIFVLMINKLFKSSFSCVTKKLLQDISYTIPEFCILLIIAIVLGVVLSIFENNKIIYKLLHALKVTNHYGDDDVWSFVCNSPDVQWVFVRDHKYDLVYYGYLEQFSDPGDVRELLLSNVSVYTNDTGKFCYNTNKIYLSRNFDELSIEIIPNECKEIIKEEKKHGRKRKSKTSERGKSKRGK